MKPWRIAGAGPSGLAAAIALADRGHAVEVFERRRAVGTRFPGSLQLLDNFTFPGDSLEEVRGLGIEPEGFVRGRFFGARFFARRGGRGAGGAGRLSSADLSGREPYGYCVRRGPEPGSLDHDLARQAEARGVSLRFSEPLDPAEADIAAVGPREADGIAAEQHFTTEAADRLEVLWDESIFPGGGYAYRIVSGGRGIVAAALIGATDRPQGSGDERLRRSAEFFQERDPMPMEWGPVRWSRVNFYLCDFSGAGPLLPGEAGGLIDYTAGFGIRTALVSGHLAGVSLAEGGGYEERIRKRFGRSVAGAIVTRLFIERFGFGPFLALAARSDFRRFAARFAGPNLGRALLAPLARRRFGRAARCHHLGPCRWCRPRPWRREEPAPG